MSQYLKDSHVSRFCYQWLGTELYNCTVGVEANNISNTCSCCANVLVGSAIPRFVWDSLGASWGPWGAQSTCWDTLSLVTEIILLLWNLTCWLEFKPATRHGENRITWTSYSILQSVLALQTMASKLLYDEIYNFVSCSTSAVDFIILYRTPCYLSIPHVWSALGGPCHIVLWLTLVWKIWKGNENIKKENVLSSLQRIIRIF